jgi:hypothetical protein
MMQKGIGVGKALFYLAWASVEELERNFEFANQIYRHGIAVKAKPSKLLKEKYAAFCAKASGLSLEAQSSNFTERDIFRLNTISARTASKLQRGRLEDKRSGSGIISGAEPFNTSNKKLQVYEDTASDSKSSIFSGTRSEEDTHPRTPFQERTKWKLIPSVDAGQKENASAFSAKPLKSSCGSKIAQTNSSSFHIFVDPEFQKENDNVPMSREAASAKMVQLAPVKKSDSVAKMNREELPRSRVNTEHSGKSLHDLSEELSFEEKKAMFLGFYSTAAIDEADEAPMELTVNYSAILKKRSAEQDENARFLPRTDSENLEALQSTSIQPTISCRKPLLRQSLQEHDSKQHGVFVETGDDTSQTLVTVLEDNHSSVDKQQKDESYDCKDNEEYLGKSFSVFDQNRIPSSKKFQVFEDNHDSQRSASSKLDENETIQDSTAHFALDEENLTTATNWTMNTQHATINTKKAMQAIMGLWNTSS